MKKLLTWGEEEFPRMAFPYVVATGICLISLALVLIFFVVPLPYHDNGTYSAVWDVGGWGYLYIYGGYLLGMFVAYIIFRSWQLRSAFRGKYLKSPFLGGRTAYDDDDDDFIRGPKAVFAISLCWFLLLGVYLGIFLWKGARNFDKILFYRLHKRLECMEALDKISGRH